MPKPIRSKISRRSPTARLIAALFIGFVLGRSTSPHDSGSPKVSPPLAAYAQPTHVPEAAVPPTGKNQPSAPQQTTLPQTPVAPAKPSVDLPPGVTRVVTQRAAENVLSGKVIGITDGDTISVLTDTRETIKVRLEGIDAPEAGQEFGAKAKTALSGMIAGKFVNVTVTGKDKYGRTLGWVDSDGVNVNRQMITEGWAWQFTDYNKDPQLAQLQANAKSKRLGLWAASSPPMAPWDFRKLGTRAATEAQPSRQPAAAASPQSTAKKEASSRYWINSNGVRHNARCRWYGNTKSGHFSNSAEGRACGICGG